MAETWRERSLRIARGILAANTGVTDPKEQRKLLSKSYPYQERMGHAYKAWCWAVNQIVRTEEQREAVRYMWVK
jgi:hypothetical protein